MRPSITQRTRLCLVLVLGLLVALFSFDAAHGQFGPNPPKSPFGPGNNSSGNNPFEHTYRCMKCGATFTSSVIGGPSHCPSCGVKFVNGGLDMGGPSGAPTPSGVASSAGTVLLLVGGGLFFVVVLVIGLVVFLVIFLNRRPAPAASVPVARPRGRYRDEDRDRFEER